MKNWKKISLDVLKIALVVVVIVLPIQTWLYKPYIVQQASMLPTVQPNQLLLINRWTYRHHAPQRGDIVVCTAPDEPGVLIKRIIGLPGETVDIRDRQVWINGQQLNEHTYLAEGIETWGTSSVTLDADHYFILGDNRNHSRDSRLFGAISNSQIVGRAELRFFPPFKRFPTPTY